MTAPHKGTFTVYITKPGYNPAKPLAWKDLDLAKPVATSTDPAATGGFYTFSGTLPQRSGKHLLYAVWQRSDSPEAFYSCSDVSFGGGDGATGGGGSADGGVPAPSASAPSEKQIEDGNAKSTVEHHGHGDNDPGTSAEPPRLRRRARRTGRRPPRPRPTGPRRPVRRRTSPRPAVTAPPRTSRSAARPRWHWAPRPCSSRPGAGR